MYYFGAPGLRKKSEKAPTRGRGVSKPRQLVANTGEHPVTSINTPVGGESGVSINNESNTLIFQGTVYNSYYPQYTAEDVEERFWFIPFENSENDPDNLDTELDPVDGIRPSNDQLIEDTNVFKVTIRPHRFTTLNTFPVLSVNYNGAKHKIKWAPKQGVAPGTRRFPYYYIEVFRGPGLPMKKIWGSMPVMHVAENNFGKKVDSEKRYLKTLV